MEWRSDYARVVALRRRAAQILAAPFGAALLGLRARVASHVAHVVGLTDEIGGADAAAAVFPVGAGKAVRTAETAGVAAFSSTTTGALQAALAHNSAFVGTAIELRVAPSGAAWGVLVAERIGR